jgi:beta-1,4-mannosyltransferase
MKVGVLVLGDVGRSPRMQYHALSLAESGADVTLIGYHGEPCVSPVEEHERITKCLFTPFSAKLPRSLFLLYAPFKVIFQILQLVYVLLFCITCPDVFLLQNPPSIPTLLVVACVAALRGSRIVIDWHNLGFTVLAERMGENHFVVKLAKYYENIFSRRGHAHFCVTAAMKDWLWENWQVRAVVLYDKPPSFFHRTALDQQHELFQRLQEDFKPVAAKFGRSISKDQTLFTDASGPKVIARDDRPALVISSTSWTPDEDFSILLDAIVLLDQKLSKMKNPPCIAFAITGKGPEKAMYQEKMRALDEAGKMAKTSVSTMWLEPGDYPKLLGSADLGVSLHTSTSGLDLPMKVLDMFGAGMPVCAIDFSCLHELVKHGTNGLVFDTTEKLVDQFHELLAEYPKSPKLHKLRDGIGNFANWSDNWRENAWPVFTSLVEEGDSAGKKKK